MYHSPGISTDLSSRLRTNPRFSKCRESLNIRASSSNALRDIFKSCFERVVIVKRRNTMNGGFRIVYDSSSQADSLLRLREVYRVDLMSEVRTVSRSGSYWTYICGSHRSRQKCYNKIQLCSTASTISLRSKGLQTEPLSTDPMAAG